MKIFMLGAVLFSGTCFAHINTPVEDPFELLRQAPSNPTELLEGAQLYKIETLDAPHAQSCDQPGWRFEFFAPVDSSVDATETARLRLEARHVATGKTCEWQWTSEVRHSYAPDWGTLPIDHEQMTYVKPDSILEEVSQHFTHPFHFKDLVITHPDLDQLAGLQYVVLGEVCGADTLIWLDGQNGTIFDALEKPLCRD